ncbi:MAG: hypothetical protein JXL20_07660 [Deltaproteobacteria bacterium]|nr:hypothetical protein [Deltaproteobacteria bacterium]
MFPTLSKIWLINVSLAALIVFFGIMSFDVWLNGDEAIPELQTGKSPEKTLPVKGIIERTMPPESTFGIVVDKNLFSSNRTESIPEKDKTGPLNISEKMVFLYGVVIAGGRKQALISNPETKPEAGKYKPKDKWVKVGDAVGNFSVADIRKDRIILADGANQHEILLYDEKKPARKTTVAQPSAAPTVVAAGPAAAAPVTAAAPQKPGTAPPAAAVAAGKSAPEGEYKIVNTPFGQIKRRIQ